LSASSAGDLNGDGIDDVIIGASGADPNGKGSAGETYVVFGQSSFTDIPELGSLDGSNGFVIKGANAYDNAGIEASCAGDLNGDGIDDIEVIKTFFNSKKKLRYL
jgi:hypothetical protein